MNITRRTSSLATSRAKRVPVGLVALIAALGLFLVLPAGPAAAQDWVVEFDAVSPASGPAGTPILVSGTCLLAPGVPTSTASVVAVRVVEEGSGEEYFNTASLHFTPDDDGYFQGYIVIPLGAPADDYQLSLRCIDGDAVLGLEGIAAFVVTDDPPEWPFVVDTTAADAGDTINVSGHCDPTTSTAAVVVPSLDGPPATRTATIVALDGLGDFTGPVNIAEDALSGDYTLGMACLDETTSTITNPQGAPLAVQGIPPTTTTSTWTSTTTTMIVDPAQPPVSPRFTG